MKTIHVAAAVICSEGRVFATQRGYGPWKDYWEFPGGKIEPGESAEEALRREIREELDTEIRVGERIASVEYDYPEFHLSMECFLAEVTEGGLVLLEHEAARWLGREELHAVNWLPADLEVVRALENGAGEAEKVSIEIQKISITDVDADAVVNAANEGLVAGGGVCGAIFAAAGHEALRAACRRIGHCDTGSAVITPGFGLKAKYIIHAVGPVWQDGKHGEPEQLYGAYYKSLELAEENGCRSIGFPLISAGIFGYPRVQAWERAVQACRDYAARHPGCGLRIIFAVRDDRIIQEGKKVLEQ